jgi:hypothetical protein
MAETQVSASASGTAALETAPTWRFWLPMGTAYALLLGVGLVLPLLGRTTSRLNLLVNMLGYVLSGLAMLAASLFLALMICRVALPGAWWLQRVRGVEVSEFDGVYFIGGRVKRLSDGARSKVFSAEDRLSRWDIAFGILVTVLTLAHGAVAFASHAILTVLLAAA